LPTILLHIRVKVKGLTNGTYFVTDYFMLNTQYAQKHSPLTYKLASVFRDHPFIFGNQSIKLPLKANFTKGAFHFCPSVESRTSPILDTILN